MENIIYLSQACSKVCNQSLLTDPVSFFHQDLARRISHTLGVDQVKIRLPLVGIHREGIKLALQGRNAGESLTPPPFLDFLEVISEFSYRLLTVDRTGQKGV